MGDLVAIALRWLHVISAITLLGGFFYARLVAVPALSALPAEARRDIAGQLAARFKPWMLAAAAGLIGSGLYNFLTKTYVLPGFHLVFGLKMLLALHIFAVGGLLGKAGVEETKRARWMTGVVASGVAVVLLSAYLRWLG